jgi:hypothetical protein
VRSSDSEAAAQSSPGRGRPELGDDQRDPRVSDPGRGRRERLRRQVGRLGPKAQAAACARRVQRWAARRLRPVTGFGCSAGLSGLRRPAAGRACWAGRLAG